MAGMSLLEVMLVLVLVAAMTLMAAMATRGGTEGMRLRSAGKTLAAELRHARVRAITTGEPQQFQLDVRSRRWHGVGGRHGELPASVAVRYTGAREVQMQQGTGVVRFFEDGASTGGRIDLLTGEAVWRIDIGWITGEVRSGPVRTEAP
ncbi:type II secretion system protein XpsH [Stenotrophomonas acidaminiphila]|jgi:general secretion pathway protein H|uniref:type II secretion system protein XpsH n=2 Tax=Stenotrophomonas TaxID=40323 RepID=UPI003BF08E52